MQNKDKTRNGVPLTVSVPSEMLKQLDYIRNDVTRSHYIQRVLNDHFKLMDSLG